MKKYFFIGVMVMSVHANGALQLKSSAFADGGRIPLKYTCDGENISPALEWSGVPEKTKSFALIVDDPDAPAKIWVHWIVFNIPSSVTELGESALTESFVCGATDFNGAQSYGGPCPPSGEHRYQFTLYALDATLDLRAGVTKEELLKAMQGHILEKAMLVGRYKRKT